jgi:hypothetical protein
MSLPSGGTIPDQETGGKKNKSLIDLKKRIREDLEREGRIRIS